MLDLTSDRVEQALRLAASAHRDQARRASGVPYITHPFAVAGIVERAGGSEDAVIAALLHDVVEDTAVRFEEILQRFGFDVAATVAECSETKVDFQGEKLPWAHRKRNHLEALRSASPLTRLVVLADKLHNLQCIRLDLAEGRPVWESFHAQPIACLAYYKAIIDELASGPEITDAIRSLAQACWVELEQIVRSSGTVSGWPDRPENLPGFPA